MQKAVRTTPKASECKRQDPENCKRELESKEDKEAKLTTWMSKSWLCCYQQLEHTSHWAMPLVKESGTRLVVPIAQTTGKQGMTNGHSYFLLSNEEEVGAPKLGRGGWFHLPSPLYRPQIISFSNSCSRGGRKSAETSSCPSPPPHNLLSLAVSNPAGPTQIPELLGQFSTFLSLTSLKKENCSFFL